MANTLCRGFMTLGALGISVLAASGDDGVSGSPGSRESCQSDNQFGVRCFVPITNVTRAQ